MKMDINELINSIFGGAAIGISVASASGKSWEWIVCGACIGIGYWTTRYIRDKKNQNRGKVKDRLWYPL
jgi:hypothetical protein